MKKLIYAFFFYNLLLCAHLHAQTVSVGMAVLDDYYRRKQLEGGVDSNVSFTIRPLFNASIDGKAFPYTPDSAREKDKWTNLKPITFANGKGTFTLLPFTWQHQFNSNLPYGWNDGAMIPARGYQTMISTGFYFKFGPLNIQLKPEYVYAANKFFEGYSDRARPQEDIIRYYYFYNNIDLPERFGTNSYSKAFWGQSSIRLTFDPISIGLSNENIWWGPGINNSLILSNNAPGFKHLTLNSVRPINSPVGHFEFQVVGARLEESNYPPMTITSFPNVPEFVTPKRHDWRYFTGFNVNYHPKWVPGLTMGLIRTFNAYGQDVKKLGDYLPYFFPYQRDNTNNGDPIPRDQITSVYARWLFPKAHAEVYFEYGLNDNSANYRDFIGSPDHSRTYLFGFRKLLPINTTNSKQQGILIGLETTQTSQSVDRWVREAGNWYIHAEIRQGHTNVGQVMGAGTGPGGNLKHADLSWINGIKKIGISFDRFEHNVDLFQGIFPDINGNSRNWVDLAFGINGQWNYKNLLFNFKMLHITSLNYQWLLKDYTPGNFYVPHNTVTNFHGQLGVTYRF